MKIRAFGIVTAVVTLFALAGCGDYEPGPMNTMDRYRYHEPNPLSHPYRVTVQKNKVEKITFPEYLFENTNTSSIKISDETILEGYGSEGMSVLVRGKIPGLARVILVMNSVECDSVVVFVTENEKFYTRPGTKILKADSSVAWWSSYSYKPDDLEWGTNETMSVLNYTADPTFQLAWKWRNPDEPYGAASSGKPCGIDMLAYVVDRSVSDKRGWVRTTYDFGGWHYDLNGVTEMMADGIQEDANVKLELKPEFVYDNGVPYLQITHILTNKTDEPLEGQKFGAAADITIFNNPTASLLKMPYGALLSDGTTEYNGTAATIKFRLVCLEMERISEASTVWMGEFDNYNQNCIYQNLRSDITNKKDTALCFSYKNIALAPGEIKKFVIWLTQVQ